MPPDRESIEGVIERVTFHADDTGYAVLKVCTASRSEPATVLCNLPAVNEGESIRATGSWINVPEYGRQFKASDVSVAAPTSLAGIERYLGSGLIHGIGPKYARKLVEKFGDRIFDVIDQSSSRLEDVRGIGKERRLKIKASWEKQKAIRAIMVFLYEHGIGTARALRIYKEYGTEAIDVLRTNPYRLCRDIHGVGFKTADTIAGKIGVAAASPQRIEAGILHVLQTASEQGHCALPEDELVAKTSSLLESDSACVAAALQSLLVEGQLARDEIHERHSAAGASLIYLPALRAAELGIADRVRRLASQPVQYPSIDAGKALDWCQEQIGIHLGESQRQAVREALRNRVLIITGGPGVGKTTILNCILRILTAKKVAPVLCAPTGRAAKRLSESTRHPAFTIHRLLEFQPATGPQRNPDKPLKGDLFVMDEASMVDAPLMHAFLRALPGNAHLLLVGDVDQLPSVGPGMVLRDLIASEKVPTVRLTEIFRQAGDSRIVQGAHAINAGRIPSFPNRNGEPAARSDLFFIERDSPDAIAATIVELILRRIPEKLGLDPMREIQVLTPMNRNSLGTASLNGLLQQSLNPATEFKLEVERFGSTYRHGDKVIQIRNNYEKEIFNGDIGVITRIDTDPVSVHVRFDDERAADYEPGELDELRLAYAITIHKSQGSEFPVVIIPVSSQHYIMLQRNLIYTGITRGKQLVVLVGDEKSLAIAVRNADQAKRITALRERLQSTRRHPIA